MHEIDMMIKIACCGDLLMLAHTLIVLETASGSTQQYSTVAIGDTVAPLRRLSDNTPEPLLE